MLHASRRPRPLPFLPRPVPNPAHGTPGAQPRRRAVAATALTAGAALLLSACAGAISVPVGPYATDPLCAKVVLALPETLNDFPRVKTTSQATAAWGEGPQEAITLRCGVEVPGPTTEHCVTVTDDSGRDVDWLTVEDTETGIWTMTTYGRDPAVEIEIPESMSTSPAVELTGAIWHVEPTRECV